MKAIILAAGRGSRMGNLTDNQPKCLTIVNSKPLIQHQIDALLKAGITDISIVTGYKAESLQQFGTYHFHNFNWMNSNMVASLFCAKDWLDTNDCIISYADIFYGPQIVRDLMTSKEEFSVAYDINWLDLWTKRFENPLDDAETFCIDGNGYITEIGQKPDSLESIHGQYMGLLKFNRMALSNSLLKISDINIEKIDMTTFLNKLIVGLNKIKAIPNFEAWGEVDSITDLEHYG